VVVNPSTLFVSGTILASFLVRLNWNVVKFIQLFGPLFGTRKLVENT